MEIGGAERDFLEDAQSDADKLFMFCCSKDHRHNPICWDEDELSAYAQGCLAPALAPLLAAGPPAWARRELAADFRGSAPDRVRVGGQILGDWQNFSTLQQVLVFSTNFRRMP